MFAQNDVQNDIWLQASEQLLYVFKPFLVFTPHFAVPSSINQITQHQSVTEGDNVTLMCNASGVPPPMVSWMTPNDERVDGYKLEVKNVSRSQAGEYKCEVSNDCGNATNVTRIDVRCKYT